MKRFLLKYALLLLSLSSFSQSISIELPFNTAVASSTAYTTDASAFFAELPTQPESRVKAAYNNAWINYPVVMSKQDRMYVNGSQYQDNSLVSLPNPTSTKKSIISTPVWQQFMGWTGAGAGTALNWNYTPSTDAVLFTQNSGCVWFYSNTNLSGLKIAIGGTDVGESNGIEIYPNFGGNVYGAINGGVSAKGITTTIGLISVVRVDASTIEIFQNGVSKGTAANAVGVLGSNSIYELASNIFGALSYPWDGQISDCGICSGDVNQVDLYNMVEGIHGDMPLYSFYGDSNTFGYLISSEANKWTSILCANKNYGQYNRAVSGSTIQDFINSGCPIRRKGFTGQKLYFNWGLNDCAIAAGTSAFTANLDLFRTAYLAAGWLDSDVLAITGWYITNAPLLLLYPAYVTAFNNWCIANSVPYIDLSATPYGLQAEYYYDYFFHGW